MKKIIKIVVIVLPVLLTIGIGIFYYLKLPNKGKIEKYDQMIVAGDILYEQKSYAQAITEYSKATDLISDDNRAYNGIVKILLLKNQLGQVKDVLEKSASKLGNVSLSSLYILLADRYLELDNTELSQQYFEKALQLDAGSELAKIGLAKTYLKNADYTKALTYLDIPATSNFYENAYVWKLMAKYSDLAGIKTFLTETVVPTEAHKKIIDEYVLVGKQVEADDVYVDTLISRIYLNNGYPKLAILLLESIKDKIAEYPDALYILSVSYYQVGRYTDVITILRDFPNPSLKPEIYPYLARSYVKTGDATLAIKYYDSSIAALGDSAKPIFQEYSQYLIDNTQYVKAKEVLDKAAKKYSDAWVDIQYVKMYIAQKNTTKTDFYLTKLGKKTNLTDAEKKQYLYYQISQYIEATKYTDATMLFPTLLAIDKYNPQYYLLSGKIYMLNSDTVKGKEALEKAIEYDLDGTVSESAKLLLNRVN
ncbi:tetratricopeptide repeat protein [Candidatus Dojkabacteria bacterium]|jgi:predicted Zn-dependent protease|nr:tetratricopeptide repeat protein [Candidatus Dojkabacteria bacterium]